MGKNYGAHKGKSNFIPATVFSDGERHRRVDELLQAKVHRWQRLRLRRHAAPLAAPELPLSFEETCRNAKPSSGS